MCTTQTSQVTNTPPAQTLANLGTAFNTAQNAANTPYQPYTGELTAPLNGGQNTAIGQLQGVYGVSKPFIQAGQNDLSQSAQGLGAIQPYLQAGAGSYAQAAGYGGDAAGQFAMSNTYSGNSADALSGVAGYQQQAANYATPVQYSADALQQYTSPYTQNVVDATQAQLNNADAQQSNQLVGNAIGSGAYGSDRSGVAQAALAGQQDIANNSTIAGLYNQSFANAQTQFNQNQANRFQASGIFGNLGSQQLGVASGYNALAGQSNQTGAGFAGLGSLSNQTGQGYQGLGTLQGQTAQTYGTLGAQEGALGQTATSTGIQGASAGLQGATLQQQTQQAQDAAAYGQFQNSIQYPFNTSQFLTNAATGVAGQSGGTSSTDGSLLSQVAGAGTAGLGVLGATGAFGSSGYLTGASGLLSSDIRVKEDVKPVGKTFDGQTMYSFKYKGSPTTHTGLIAQEVADKHPGAVGGMGDGTLGVDYGKATEAASDRGHFKRGGVVTLGNLDQMSKFKPTAGLSHAMKMLRPHFDDGGIAYGSALNDAAPVMGSGVAGAGIVVPQAARTGNNGMGGVGGSRMPAAQAQQPSGLGVMSAPVGGSSTPYAGPGSQANAAAIKADPFGAGNSNMWQGITAAGLGMMSGTSMSPLANIGAGGLAGLDTYNRLNQQDRTNALQQQEFGLKQSDVSLRAQQLQAEIKHQSVQDTNQTIQTGTMAANTKSEVAARDQATKVAGFTRSYVPGVGFIVTDNTNPYKPPQIVPMPTGVGPSSSDGTGSAPVDPSTPSPQGAPPAAAGPSTGPSPSAAPAAGAAPVSSPVSAPSAPPQPATPSVLSWKPATAAPQGFVPPNQVGIYQSGALKQEQDVAKGQLETARQQSDAANTMQYRLDEMDHQFAQLPKTGMLAAGPGAEARGEMARTVNQYVKTLGGQPIFDENADAALQNLTKDRFRLGADLAKSMGGREPGYIVQQAVKMNPGSENTPLGYQRITAGLRQAAQQQQDKAAFLDDYNAKFGHLNGAEQEFNKLNPPQMYANRAIASTVDPRDIQALTSNATNPAAQQAIDKKYGDGVSSILLGRPLTIRGANSGG